jgi:Flp pilus assembly protein TadD
LKSMKSRRQETGDRRLLAALAGIAMLCASCAHRTPVTASTGVGATLGKHIQNAIDAGDGDLEVRAMRQRLAANADDLDARLALARRYAQRGLPDLALEHYRLAAARFPDSAPVALGVAKMLRELSQQEAALQSLQAFLAAHPNASWEALSLQGILFDERGKYTEAETSHRAALALDANRSALHNNLGYNLTLQGKRDAAIAEFHRALELDATSDYAKNNLAMLEAMNGKGVNGQSVNLWKRVTLTLGRAVLGPPESNGGATDGAKK